MSSQVAVPRTTYTAGDILQLLQIRPHVLRYWEQTLPIVRSSRDDLGHRVWSAAQVRMLLRIHHLVVRRGVSVAAAGEALLREAASPSAEIKAGLEQIRSSLVVALIRQRALRAAENPTVAAPQENRCHREDHRDTVALEPLIHQGTVPPVRIVPRETGGCVPPGHSRMEAPSREESSTPLIVYSHLFARGTPQKIAPLMMSLIIMRLEQEARLSRSAALERLLFAVPADEEWEYRRVLGDGPTFLRVADLSWGATRWRAPTCSVLLAVAASDVVHRHETVLFWAPDNPASTPRDWFSSAACKSPAGIALGVTPHGDAHVLTENMALHCAHFRDGGDGIAAVLRQGRWSAGPVERPLNFSQGNTDGTTRQAVRDSLGFRFDVWMRDLPGASAGMVAVPRGSRSAPWRGDHWLSQMPLVWPGIPSVEGVVPPQEKREDR